MMTMLITAMMMTMMTQGADRKLNRISCTDYLNATESAFRTFTLHFTLIIILTPRQLQKHYNKKVRN